MPAHAQHWATRDRCDVTNAVVHANSIAPFTQDQLTTVAGEITNGIGRFWRVESPQGAVSHLWGTLHSNDPLILDLPDRVTRAIQGARVVAPEIDFISPTRRKYELLREYRGWWRPHRSTFVFDTANTGLPPKVIDWIKTRFVGIGWGRDVVDTFTYGGLVSVLLSNPCDDFAAGIIPNQDSRIQMLGMISGAHILGLEAPDATLRHLNRTESEATALAIIAVYGAYLNPTGTAQDRATSFALYRAGRIAEMQVLDAQYLGDVLGSTGALALALADDYLLAKRNRNFLDAARADLIQGGVFMAIGSFHLPGPDGMVALLRRSGFAVTRQPLPGEPQ